MIKTLIAPTGMPLSVLDARLQTAVASTEHDPLLQTGIRAAWRGAETATQRTLLATRFSEVFDAFPGPALMSLPPLRPWSMPGHAIGLIRTPLLQVVSIQYLDMTGTLQTMPVTDYVADDSGPVSRITPVFGKIWPIPLPQIASVRVTYDAGYATPAVADATANTMTIGLWRPLVVGDVVRWSNSGGTLPAPLQPQTDYYVATVSGSAIQVAATPGGAIIDLADAGTGLHFLGEIPEGVRAWMLLMIGALFENRELVAVLNRGKVEELPFVEALLDDVRVAGI